MYEKRKIIYLGYVFPGNIIRMHLKHVRDSKYMHCNPWYGLLPLSVKVDKNNLYTPYRNYVNSYRHTLKTSDVTRLLLKSLHWIEISTLRKTHSCVPQMPTICITIEYSLLSLRL